ncbi:hypothetical protein SOVF_078410 [Spinacia oleracea]|nr:hypothetical protein SOVF_078410 [Spinacia oleracea]
MATKGGGAAARRKPVVKRQEEGREEQCGEGEGNGDERRWGSSEGEAGGEAARRGARGEARGAVGGAARRKPSWREREAQVPPDSVCDRGAGVFHLAVRSMTRSRGQLRNLQTVEEDRNMELEARVDWLDTSLEVIISTAVRDAMATLQRSLAEQLKAAAEEAARKNREKVEQMEGRFNRFRKEMRNMVDNGGGSCPNRNKGGGEDDQEVDVGESRGGDNILGRNWWFRKLDKEGDPSVGTI